MAVDHIDLFQLHGQDYNTPVEETLATLDGFVTAGKIRYIGCSNFSGWHLMKSLNVSDRYGYPRHMAHQAYYSLLNRDYEWELMPLGQDQGVGAVVWSPLGWGKLTGRIRRGQPAPAGTRAAQITETGPKFEAERLYRILLAGLFVAGLLALYFFYRRLQRSRLLELRANIAQDLHDDLGSEMSGISLASFSAARSGDPARMGEALQTIAGQSSRLVEDMRDIVWSIHPDNDSLEKIAARMRQYAAQMLEPQDVAVHFQVAANALPLKMQPEARKHLYLFFKEAIHNIARHAQCDRADISIRRENGSFVLEIRDNGQGFEPNAPLKTTGGNGLRNLRNRAEVLGGKLVVESTPGAGTVLRLVAPLA
jgi:signal transduction histidine kinase